MPQTISARMPQAIMRLRSCMIRTGRIGLAIRLSSMKNDVSRPAVSTARPIVFSEPTP